MDQKETLKLLMKKCLDGKLKEVYKSLMDNQINIEPQIAFKFLLCCCNACHNNMSTVNNISDYHLQKLINYLMKIINTSPEKVIFDSYSQAVFFILKLLLKKRNFNVIFDLEDFIIPKFEPSILSKMQIQIGTWEGICIEIFNTVVQISNSKDASFNSNLIKVVYLLTNLCKKFLNQNFLLDKAHKSTICLMNLGVDAIFLQNYFLHVISLIEIEKETIENTLFENIMNIFLIVFNYLLKQNKFAESLDCFSKSAAIFEKLFNNKEHEYLIKIMPICVWLIPNCKNNSLSNYHDNLKYVYKEFGATKRLEIICTIISTTTFTLAQYYKKTSATNWFEYKFLPNQLQFYKFLYYISRFLAKFPKQCKCKDCNVTTNMYESLNCFYSIFALGKKYVVHTSDCSHDYIGNLHKYLEKYCALVIASKEKNCDRFNVCWPEISMNLYSIAFDLYKKLHKKALIFLNAFVKLVFEAEGTEMLTLTYLRSALNAISDIHCSNNNFKKCLATVAFNITLSPNINESCDISRWMKYKSLAKESVSSDDEIQKLTIVNALKQFDKDIKYYNSKFQINKQQKIELLILELENYKNKWKSKLPMMSTYEELTEIADSFTLAKVSVSIWGQCHLAVHQKTPNLLMKTINKFELDLNQSSNKEFPFYLAYLYYLYHKYQIKDAIIKNCDDMEKTINMIPVKSGELQNVDKDINDECDIISVYDSLKIEKYIKMMTYLNKSLDILLGAMSKNFELNIFENMNSTDIYGLLTEIGHEFRLHTNTVCNLQAWELALKIAKLLKNELLTIQAISHIIEFSDTTKNTINNLIIDADNIADKIDTKNELNLNILITYYINKSIAYFYNNFDIAYSAFQQANKLINNADISDDNILRVRMYSLHHKFISLPCNYNIIGHEEYSSVNIHIAYKKIMIGYSKYRDDNCSYFMSIFFDIIEDMVRMYQSLRLPREVRCYGRDATVIAQKLVLPLRTSFLLTVLAHADVTSCRFDDARLKVVGLSEILSLNMRRAIIEKSPQIERWDLNNKDIIDDLTHEFQEIMLDASSKPHFKQANLGSPNFEVESFKFPSFFEHQDNCDCFYCVNMEYHDHVLRHTHLNALLNEYQNNRDTAKNYYFGSLKMFKILKTKWFKHKGKILKFISNDLIPSYENKLFETYCCNLYECVNNFLRSEMNVEAKQINASLINQIKPKKLKYIHLYNDVLIQKLNILLKNNSNQNQQKPTTIDYEANTNDLAKTPENKESRVTIPVAEKFESFTQPEQYVKKLQFSLKDNEDDVPPPKSKKSPVTVTLPPFLSVQFRTPAPSTSKVKIYTSTEKTKPIIPSNVTQIENFSVPVNLAASTPVVEKNASNKIENDLLTRTKLLTKKLKVSTAKKTNKDVPIITINNNDTIESGTNQSVRPTTSRNIRKNLLSELDDEKNMKDAQLRRSKRNK